MKKMIKVLGLVALMTLGMSFQAFAGEWKKDTTGWWWQNDNGTYPVNKWEWLDGNKDGIAECYYFNESGYCLIATTTPDNYTVNESGAWTVNGVVQTKNMFISNEDRDRDDSEKNVNNQNEDKQDKKASEKNVNTDNDIMTQLEKDRQALRDMGLTDEQIDQMANNPARHSEYGGLH